MSSPFPGMDPYLESPRFWHGFHQAFLTYMRDALQPTLRPKYRAELNERVYVESSGRHVYPDVAVLKGEPPAVHETVLAYEVEADDAPALPVIVEVTDEAIREPYIEIQGRDGQVVTVIELLSPANKTPYTDGRQQYLQKQAEMRNSSVHLVEIDLLRSGEHTVAVPKELLGRVPPHDYLACVVRKPKAWRFELYPFTLRHRMPDIKVPLFPDDEDIALPLQSVLDKAYENGAYADVIDYSVQPEPPLTDELWEWAQQRPATDESGRS